MTALNQTHDPRRRSWVASANDPATDFPIQNLPFGVFRRGDGRPRGGVAIGDQVLDLSACLEAGLLPGAAAEAARAAAGETLDPLLALGNGAASALRAALSDLLRLGGPDQARAEQSAGRILVPRGEAEMLMPATVRQFTDMCVSTFHIGGARHPASRAEPRVPRVMKWLPVGYNGRASSVVVSGTPVVRPNGEWLAAEEDDAPRFGPEPRQDYELELGIWLGGPGNRLGEPVPIEAADRHILGFCLLNDWSARGIQMWETMLGPFLGKSQATTISPWIVTTEAMAPFRIAAFRRPEGDPAILPYLYSPRDQAMGGYDITLDALIRTTAMRESLMSPARICRTNFRHMYWTAAQMVTHHASNGCDLGAGDLIGSGTCSGPEESEAGCLLETTWRGTRRWSLPNGESRLYLEDGDEVILRGRATREGYVPIGFGDNVGQVAPSPAWPAPQESGEG